MIKNIIFDYMGVLATVDYKGIANEFPLTDKFKALRLLVGLKKNKFMREAFHKYQTGELSTDDCCYIASGLFPKSAPVLPKLFESIPKHIIENKELVALAKKMHDDGFKIILLSNSIPETQISIQNSPFVEYFDGFVLSNLVGLRKPDPEIYKLACDTYGLKPDETYMIDDKPENLIGAKEAHLKTLHCDNFNTIAEKLGNYFYSNYQPSSK